jgi:hypothetical protein
MLYVSEWHDQTAGILCISFGPEVLRDVAILLLTPQVFLQLHHVTTYVHTQGTPVCSLSKGLWNY